MRLKQLDDLRPRALPDVGRVAEVRRFARPINAARFHLGHITLIDVERTLLPRRVDGVHPDLRLEVGVDAQPEERRLAVRGCRLCLRSARAHRARVRIDLNDVEARCCGERSHDLGAPHPVDDRGVGVREWRADIGVRGEAFHRNRGADSLGPLPSVAVNVLRRRLPPERHPLLRGRGADPLELLTR